MKIYDIICNFKIMNISKVHELKANLYEMEHISSGAKVLWIDRKDDNKTFAIGFKTIPEDNTGVFHILEHSVLNGSEKYTTKEPFVNLLKSSLQTFLNALTFQDKTLYPISSRNHKDFLNLINVYMDAVLHPSIYKKPEIFMQEGWHYELLSPEAQPIYKGVVFNEMKGALSSPDETMQLELNKLLFPDNCYRFVSGGHPESIPDLTYEQFIDSHRRFYHPSNSYIILDGSIDLEATLGLLDSEYLSKYSRATANFHIPMQSPVPYTEIEKEYEIAPDESTKEKTILSKGYVIGSYKDKETIYAMNILCDMLCGSNDAPLKHALLSKGLSQDVSLYVNDGIQQPYVSLGIWNTDKEKINEIKETIHNTLSDLVAKGLHREQLVASFNKMEFSTRNREGGWMTPGVLNAINVLDSWLYGGDPVQNLSFNDTFANLREKLSTGYFEELIEKYLLNNPHSSMVCLVPSTTLGEEKNQKEVNKLKGLKEGWSQEEIEELIKVNENLIKWQQTPDSKEDVDSIPMLKLSDIKPEPEKLSLSVDKEGDIPLLLHDVADDGIDHISLYFSASDLTLEELPYSALMTTLLGKLGTSKSNPLDVQTLLKSNVGRFNISTEVYSKPGNIESCQVFVTADLSLLASKKADSLKLIHELLTETDFNNPSMIKNMLKQMEMQYQQSLISSGHSYAATRVMAYTTSSGVAAEYLSGYEFYNWLKEMNKNLDDNIENIIMHLKAIAKKLFTRNRVTLSLSGNKVHGEFIDMINALPCSNSEIATEAHYRPLGIRQEGIIIPAAIAFAVKGSNIYLHKDSYTGSYNVLSKVLSMDYLWNEIRVQGGAYGTGFNSSLSGNAFFYSYRDPDAARSLEAFDRSADYIKDFCKDEDDLDKLIIGSISDSEPLLNTRRAIKIADANYFCGITFEDLCKIRREMLSTTKEDLLSLCSTLDAISDDHGICVVGGKDKLQHCDKKLTTILSI